MASSSVLPGLEIPLATLVAPAPISTAAVSAVSSATEPVAAKCLPDPRHVVTPLDPNRAEELLCKYDLISDWNHIITGLREGFDIGIREQLSRCHTMEWFPSNEHRLLLNIAS
jgi:hypothetical protein